MRRSHLSILLFLALYCFLGLALAQVLTSYDESRALLEYEANTVEVAARYGESVVGVRVVRKSAAPGARLTLRSGSGFLIHLSGRPYFVTSHHVLSAAEEADGEAIDAEATKLEVVFSGRPDPITLPVRVRYESPGWDLALLEPLEPAAVPDVPPIPLGDSDSLQLGQKVIVIGSPFGLSRSVTTGAVSALNRRLPGHFPAMIQTDAATNHGSSGGPLLTAQGEVVGVATAIYNPDGDVFAGVSLAVPLRPFVESLAGLGLSLEPLRPVRDVTLVDVRDLPRSVHVLYGVPDEGLLVMSVAPGGAAARAGLRGGSRNVVYGSSQWLMGGDVIVSVKEVGAAKPTGTATDAANDKLCDVTLVRSGQSVSLLLPQTVLAVNQPTCSFAKTN